jgi:hypothetical protein
MNLQIIRIFLSEILFVIFLIIFFDNCQKDRLISKNIIETEINNVKNEFELKKIVVEKRIIAIDISELKKNYVNFISITVNGDDEKKYVQSFDYKTGISLSECSLNYKILPKNNDKSSMFYASYEGFVKIKEISKRKRQISIEYDFRLFAVPNDYKTYTIKGSITNCNY